MARSFQQARKKKKRKLNNRQAVAAVNSNDPPQAAAAAREPKVAKKDKDDSSSSKNRAVIISSQDAADRIRQASSQRPLLVITSDASGDGACSGLAAVLRCIYAGGDAVLPVLGRLPWDDSVPAEIAAASLGLDAAVTLLQTQQMPLTCDVLLVSDCNAVLSFYTGNGKSSNFADSETWIASMRSVLDSSSNDAQHQRRVMMTRVRSNHTKYSGYFDHEAADLLSAMARDPEAAAVNHDVVQNVPPFHDDKDIQWLAESSLHKKQWPLYQKCKKGGGSSGPRKKRCKARIHRELHIQVP